MAATFAARAWLPTPCWPPRGSAELPSWGMHQLRSTWATAARPGAASPSILLRASTGTAWQLGLATPTQCSALAAATSEARGCLLTLHRRSLGTGAQRGRGMQQRRLDAALRVGYLQARPRSPQQLPRAPVPPLQTTTMMTRATPCPRSSQCPRRRLRLLWSPRGSWTGSLQSRCTPRPFLEQAREPPSLASSAYRDRCASLLAAVALLLCAVLL